MRYRPLARAATGALAPLLPIAYLSPMLPAPLPRAPLTDGLGRRISYLRISVTDRCDLRCRYCMAEKMQFLPKNQVLTLEEIALLADLFIARGITRIRLTGASRWSGATLAIWCGGSGGIWAMGWTNSR